ncbi:13453_t:CDS:2, partial [Racocetra fulgida]
NKLVDEAKNLTSQRIVPVSAPTALPMCGNIALPVCGSIAMPASRFLKCGVSDEYDEVEEFDDEDEFSPALAATSVKSKPQKIETLYNFLDFQSFDGSFLPSTKFYSWFDKNDFKDFEIIGIESEKLLCLALAMAYLEIIMFETFKEESEMCYEKAKKVLKKEVGDDEQKINEILEKAKEWVKKWAAE